jgi:hypothetical protein
VGGADSGAAATLPSPLANIVSLARVTVHTRTINLSAFASRLPRLKRGSRVRCPGWKDSSEPQQRVIARYDTEESAHEVCSSTRALRGIVAAPDDCFGHQDPFLPPKPSVRWRFRRRPSSEREATGEMRRKQTCITEEKLAANSSLISLCSSPPFEGRRDRPQSSRWEKASRSSASRLPQSETGATSLAG